MKIYVDELPEDCLDCPCESEYYCNLLNTDVGCLRWGEKHKDCPLKLIDTQTKDKLELTETALELACEQIWAMSIWENTKNEVVADNIEFFKTKAKEMLKNENNNKENNS